MAIGVDTFPPCRVAPMSECARMVGGITLVLAVLVPGRVRAQSAEQSLALGVAVPTGAFGMQQAPGPLLRGGFTFGDRQSSHVRLRLRLDLEAAWLP